MAKGQSNAEDLLRELISIQQTQLIVSLALAGVAQRQIREIVGVDMNRVAKILKSLKKNIGVRNG